MTKLQNIKNMDVPSQISKSQEKSTAGKLKLFMNSDMTDFGFKDTSKKFEEIINPKSTGTNRKQLDMRDKWSNERLGNSLMISRIKENYSSVKEEYSTKSDHKVNNDYKFNALEMSKDTDSL